jgi:hypothetical protein
MSSSLAKFQSTHSQCVYLFIIASAVIVVRCCCLFKLRPSGMMKDDLWLFATVEYGNLLKLKHNKSAGDIV